jgi:hypothetical protein
MPTISMDYWVIAGVIIAVIGVWVAFARRPKKTSNTITNGSHNTQSGGEGTTINKITDGDRNDQSG